MMILSKIKNYILGVLAAIAGLLYFLRVKDQRDDAKHEEEEAKARADHMTRVLTEKEKYYKKQLTTVKSEKQYDEKDANTDGDITIRL